jgi:terminase large subunit-like protein
MTKQWTPTDWQHELLSVPETINTLAAGGRGVGRTTGARMIALRHGEKYKDRARILICRETLKSLQEFEDELHAVLSAAFLRGLKVNRQDHTFKIPGGAVIECAPLEGAADYAKLQGRSFSLIVVDEYGNFRTSKWVDLLRSNLRGDDVPCRMILLANPGGRQHQTIQSRYIARAASWEVFDVDGRPWVIAPGTFRDNEHLPPDYEKELFAACGRDRELYRCWRDGSWNINRGAFFADVIDESKQMFAGDGDGIRPQRGLFGFVAADWGITSPSVAFGCVKMLAPFRQYPRGSLILVDEVHSSEGPGGWDIGLQWTPGRLADGINDMISRNGLGNGGCIDDARGLGTDETLIKEMRNFNLCFTRPAKGRREGWAKMRELLFNSKEANGRPGMWISDRCRGFWETVPVAPRDPIRPDDLDSGAIDHWCDAARYAATHEPQIMTITRNQWGP